MSADQQYLGNPNLKKANVAQSFTPDQIEEFIKCSKDCLLYTSPSPRDATLSRMPSSA